MGDGWVQTQLHNWSTPFVPFWYWICAYVCWYEERPEFIVYTDIIQLCIIYCIYTQTYQFAGGPLHHLHYPTEPPSFSHIFPYFLSSSPRSHPLCPSEPSPLSCFNPPHTHTHTYCPSGHAVQVPAPAAAANWPATHSTHVEMLVWLLLSLALVYVWGVGWVSSIGLVSTFYQGL